MMSESTTRSATPIHDVIGIGFGPSNLALAVAAAEHNADVLPDQRLSVRFLERQPRFGWHRGMLIDDARMQVSFLKDLATMRNPRSRYSFLSYLHDKDRLVDFLNCQTFFPTRVEFHDYLEWVASDFTDRVDYDTEVVEICEVGGDPGLLEVVARRKDLLTCRYRARNVVIGTGLAPNLPAGVHLSDRVWHNRDLVMNVARFAGTEPKRFVVVGAGQSAAESVEYLHRSFPGAEVRAVFSRYGYSPADDSSFANRVFDPSAAEEFYTASAEVKDSILGYHRNTNYSVVDPDLIKALYDKHYSERVAGSERLQFHNVSRVTDLEDLGTSVAVTVESMIERTRVRLDCDAVVYATGYRSGNPTRFLGPLGDRVGRDGEGRLGISRDYRLDLPGVDADVYVQGATEHTHGIASTLISNAAVRSGVIVDSVHSRLLARRTDPAQQRTPVLSGHR